MRKNSTLLALAVLLLTLHSIAQDTPATVLKPPKGAQVAIIIFEDLECPDCARAAPLLEEASKTYNIPVVRHDFPLAFHKWSFDAALIARYFDKTSRKTGNEFRDYIFEHQPEITPANLRSFAEKFATDHKLDLPFVVDPKGELAAKITADKNLGVGGGIQHTPTIYVVSNKTQGKPFVELCDRTK